MFKNKILQFVLLSFVVMLFSMCKKDANNSSNTPILLLPANNKACISGASIGNNMVAVIFSWNALTNSDGYDLVIKNLSTKNSTTYSTTDISCSVNLTNNNPYSWYVVAKSGSSTTNSEVWKFYLSGTSSDYAPFPADVVAPLPNATISANGATTVNVTLIWSGGDIDNDIKSYTVYLDENNASTVLIPTQTATSVTTQLVAGKTYFWKVVTTDAVGNTSESVVSKFTIK